MRWSGRTTLRSCAALALGLPVATASFPASPAARAASPQPVVRILSAEPQTAPSAATAAGVADLPFAGMAELSADLLVQQVLARNPSLALMEAAWQAASARYPQVTS